MGKAGRQLAVRVDLREQKPGTRTRGSGSRRIWELGGTRDASPSVATRHARLMRPHNQPGDALTEDERQSRTKPIRGPRRAWISPHRGLLTLALASLLATGLCGSAGNAVASKGAGDVLDLDAAAALLAERLGGWSRVAL